MFHVANNILMAEKSYGFGVANMKKGKINEAIVNFTGAYTLNNNQVNALYMRGICLTHILCYPEALESLQLFLKLSPPNEHTNDARAVVGDLEKYLKLEMKRPASPQ